MRLPSRKDSGGEPSVATHNGAAVLLTIFSAALNSAGGILVRSMDAASEWQIVFWRAFALAVAISGIVWFEHRTALAQAMRRIGPWSLLGGMFYGVTLIGYVLALTNTTVANADFTMSAIPIFTALFAWLVLGERVRMRTGLAIAAAVAGIGLMLGDGIAAGTLFGNAMALLASVSFACFVIVLRKGQAIDMLPTAVVGAAFATLVAAFMAEGDIKVSTEDLALCLLWGGVISCVAHFLIVTASRNLSGAELTLLLLVEFILGPVWVWLLIDETPSDLTLAGGAIVLAAVAGHALMSMRAQTNT